MVISIYLPHYTLTDLDKIQISFDKKNLTYGIEVIPDKLVFKPTETDLWFQGTMKIPISATRTSIKTFYGQHL
jgi:hypothetical protein